MVANKEIDSSNASIKVSVESVSVLPTAIFLSSTAVANAEDPSKSK